MPGESGMKVLTLALMLLTRVALADEFIERWPGSKHEWRVVEQINSDHGKSLTVVITVPGGIFPVAMHLQDTKIEKVTLRLQNIRGAEGVSFLPLKTNAKEKVVWKNAAFEPAEVSLKDTSGFKVGSDGQDQVLEFTGKALELLRRGGRFQFIDAYR
jgi:hypothetical protein